MPRRFGQTTPLTSMRVHGTAARIQFPEKDISNQPLDPQQSFVDYSSIGAIVHGYNARVWVHFSIPAPKPLEPNSLLIVSRVFVFYETIERYPEIQSVQVRDGKRSLLSKSNLHLSGKLTEKIVPANSWEPDQIVLYSLGVSLEVQFPIATSKEGAAEDPITFTGAGADYSVFVPTVDSRIVPRFIG